MLILLPFLSFVLILNLCHSRSQVAGPIACWRSSFLTSAVVWGLLVAGFTEFLNLFHFITRGSVGMLWAFAVAVCLALAVRRHQWVSLRISMPKLSTSSTVLAIGAVLVIAITGLTALIAPPNTWDSMAYHMSRVAHWIQNQSVDFYATPILRQNHMNPWTEFAIMHLQILSGGDRFANLVQWFSMVCSVLGVTLIARQLGASKSQQILTATIAVTIPMGILQASSTKNDYAVTCWLVCLAYSLLRFREKGENNSVWLAASSLALAMHTKATGYLFALPFVLWFGGLLFIRFRRKVWKPIVVFAALCLAVNFGHFARNFRMYGSPLGPGRESDAEVVAYYANGVFTPAAFASNILRNLSLHMGTTVRTLNVQVENAVRWAHTVIGADPSAPQTTWKEPFEVKRLSTAEAFAGNFMHLMLAMFSMATLLVFPSVRKHRPLILYTLCVVSGFLLFCFYLRWQLFHSRLHLPIFVLGTPIIAYALSSLPIRFVSQSVGFALVLVCYPWLLHNPTRPLHGENMIFKMDRTDMYFIDQPQLKVPFTGAADFVRSQHCSDVGIQMTDWEYPLWVVLQETVKDRVRLEHVGIDVRNNVSAGARTIPPLPDSFKPCVLIP